MVLQLMILSGQIILGSSLNLKCEENASATMSCQSGPPLIISDDARDFLKNISKESMTLNDTILTCYHGSPSIIGQGVVGVFLRKHRTRPEVEYFRHPSWTDIEFLDIHSCDDTDFYLLLSDKFSSLKNLKYLGIHNTMNGLGMAPTAFKGLDRLKVLDLSDCRHLFLNNPLKYPFLINALSRKDILPALTILNLENAGIFNARPMKIEASFFRMVLRKNIRIIKLKRQTLIVDFKFHDIWTTQPYMPFPLVSLQASMIVFVISDIFNEENKWRNIPFWTVFRKFKSLSLSDFDASRLKTPTRNHDKVYSLCRENSPGDTFVVTAFIFLVEVNLRNIKVGNIDQIENLKVDASACTVMRLKTVRVNHSGLRKLNLTFKIPDKIWLNEIDISDNSIGYFFVKGNLETKKLILRNNTLQEMNDYAEFSQAFAPFTLLEHLDLSWNALRSLPQNIFRTNTNLTVILLNNNKLTSIAFIMNHLKSLQLLQLKNNQIKYLDQYGMAIIEDAINGVHTFVDLAKNPFECSCRTAKFVRWLSNSLNQSQDYTCSMEYRKVIITRNTFKSCQYLCYRDIIHICVIVGCCLFVILVMVVCLKRYKALRAKEYERNKQTFIDNFIRGNRICSNDTQGNQRIDYIVMLAYHEDDYDMCKTYIYERLRAGLAALIGTEENLVLFGLDKENPGVSKFAEIERCTHICCVCACVVTRAFCDDYWCKMQLENADYEGKPIIFFFVDDLEDNIPPFLKVLLRRVFVTRLYCPENILTPSWETSCLGILDLAVRAQLEAQPQVALSTRFKRSIYLCYSYILRLCRKPHQDGYIELLNYSD